MNGRERVTPAIASCYAPLAASLTEEEMGSKVGAGGCWRAGGGPSPLPPLATPSVGTGAQGSGGRCAQLRAHDRPVDGCPGTGSRLHSGTPGLLLFSTALLGVKMIALVAAPCGTRPLPPLSAPGRAHFPHTLCRWCPLWCAPCGAGTKLQ